MCDEIINVFQETIIQDTWLLNTCHLITTEWNSLCPVQDWGKVAAHFPFHVMEAQTTEQKNSSSMENFTSQIAIPFINPMMN